MRVRSYLYGGAYVFGVTIVLTIFYMFKKNASSAASLDPVRQVLRSPATVPSLATPLLISKETVANLHRQNCSCPSLPPPSLCTPPPTTHPPTTHPPTTHPPTTHPPTTHPPTTHPPTTHPPTTHPPTTHPPTTHPPTTHPPSTSSSVTPSSSSPDTHPSGTVNSKSQPSDAQAAQFDLPVILVISPTHARLTQKVDLTTVCYTFMHVQNLVWIVIEDSKTKSELVRNVLERCKVHTIHLNAVTPLSYRRASWYPRGVAQRNAGLSWIRQHYSSSNCSGVVYFADDDNKYDLRLFEKMRKTKKVSVWHVAFAGGLKYEGPECENGQAVKWHASWGKNRQFPIDMAGFAIQLCLLLEHKNLVVGKDRRGRYTQPGYLESNILEQLATRETVECLGPNNDVYVWHTKTEKPVVVNEARDPSRGDVEV